MSRVLIIGDTHAPVMLDGYIDHLKKTRDKYKCDEVVHIGDSVDWHTMSFHPKVPRNVDPEEEYINAWNQMQELYFEFPNLTYLVGNHSCIPQRRADAAGIPEFMMKDFNALWDVPEWDVVPRYESFEIDGVLYQHGDRGRGGQYNSAYLNAQDEHQSVVQGHFHSQFAINFFANKGSRIFGMQVGCGIDHKHAVMSYGIKFNKKPIVGCGVVIDGEKPHLEAMEL